MPCGHEAMKEQDLCNKITAKILENYNILFEVEDRKNNTQRYDKQARLTVVKVSNFDILTFSIDNFGGSLFKFSLKSHMDITLNCYL